MCRWAGRGAWKGYCTGQAADARAPAPALLCAADRCPALKSTNRPCGPHPFLQEWLKEAAPTSELRQWFNHEPERWLEFQRRYAAELDDNRDAWAPLAEAARHGKVGWCGRGRAGCGRPSTAGELNSRRHIGCKAVSCAPYLQLCCCGWAGWSP